MKQNISLPCKYCLKKVMNRIYNRNYFKKPIMINVCAIIDQVGTFPVIAYCYYFSTNN